MNAGACENTSNFSFAKILAECCKRQAARICSLISYNKNILRNFSFPPSFLFLRVRHHFTSLYFSILLLFNIFYFHSLSYLILFSKLGSRFRLFLCLGYFLFFFFLLLFIYFEQIKNRVMFSFTIFGTFQYGLENE